MEKLYYTLKELTFLSTHYLKSVNLMEIFVRMVTLFESFGTKLSLISTCFPYKTMNTAIEKPVLLTTGDLTALELIKTVNTEII